MPDRRPAPPDENPAEGCDGRYERPEPPPRRGRRLAREWLLPALAGMAGALALFGVYREGRRRGAGGQAPASLSATARPEAAPSARPASPAWVGERAVDPVVVNDLYNRSRRLLPMAEPLGPARPGEWRHIAQEASQSYYQFARDPRRPAFDSARTVVLQPLGDLSAPATRLLPLMGEFLSCFLDLPVRVATPLEARAVPEAAWRRRGSLTQLDAEYAMRHVLAPRLSGDSALIVGVTGADLRPGDRWEFQNAFGWSSFTDRTAIVSVARAFPGNDRRDAALADLLHMLKFTAHEAGHALGILHCDRYACLMNGRASLPENASKPLWLCPDCYAKVSLATGFNGPRRARRLAEFCGKVGLEAERGHWLAVGKAVQQ